MAAKKYTDSAFIAGWYHGFRKGEASEREALAAEPWMDAEQTRAFCQGSVDGAIGDTARYPTPEGFEVRRFSVHGANGPTCHESPTGRHEHVPCQYCGADFS